MTKSLPAALSARKSVIIGLLTLGLLVGGFGGWSYFAKINSAIIALGQVEVERNKQIVQHPEGGVVAEIAVKEAQTVSAGDVLIRLDSTVLQSELDLIEAQLYSSIARRDRLNSELADKATPLFSAILNRLSPKRPELAEQIALFHSRKASLLRQSAELGKRQHQITLQTKGLTAQFAATKRQLSYINADLAVKIKLQSQGLVQSSPVLALQREAARLQGDLATLTTAQAVATERAIEVTLEALRLREIRQEAISAELQDLNPKIATLAERQTQLTDQITMLAVRAPVSGVILGLQVTAPRAVLRAAEPILYIVPQDRPLIVSVNIPPLHRDETHVGQQVRLVFPSFSARNMPSIFGHLTGLSADALIDPRSQLAYYRADIAIDTDQMAKLATTPLLPGMPVEAFIETGAQAPITYLLKPITDYFAKAMRES